MTKDEKTRLKRFYRELVADEDFARKRIYDLEEADETLDRETISYLQGKALAYQVAQQRLRYCFPDLDVRGNKPEEKS